MGKISLNERTVTVKEGVFKKVILSLDSLRLLYLIAPGSFKWFVVTSSSQSSFINLDELPEGKIKESIKKFLSEVQFKL